MKTLSTLVKFQLLVVFVLGAAVFNSFAQESNQTLRYTSTKYKFTFQAPKDSAKKPDSSEENVTFMAQQPKFELGSSVNVAVIEEPLAELISQSLASDEGLEPFIKGMVEGFESEGNAKFTLTEKKRLKIAGLNSVKVAGFTIFGGSSEVKIRLVAITVPVPAHKRMYVFTVTGVDKDFDKWLPVAEASVNSFALIRAEPVKP